jgi:hypothetical protein
MGGSSTDNNRGIAPLLEAFRHTWHRHTQPDQHDAFERRVRELQPDWSNCCLIACDRR